MLFTDEHELVRKSLRSFFEREIVPHCDAWEEERIFPAHEVFKKMGNEGFLGLTKPEEYGGAGLDYSYAIVLAEELGRLPSGGVSMAIGVQTDMCTPALARFGSDELRREWLAPSIAGDLVGCIGVSEVGAGSDVASLKTTARKDGDDYIINGGKMWITNGIQADWMCCLVNTSDDKAHKNKSLVIIPLASKGVERARKLHKLGMWASDTAQIFFDEVRVPQRYRIGAEGMGFMLQMLQFQEERMWGATNSVSAMDMAVAATIEYTRDRKAFGKSILDNQVVHFRMAELATEIEALRALNYRTAELFLAGQDVTRLASMCKLKAGRLLREVSDSCLQYWGGMGYMWESKISRMFRDARLCSIGGGADEIMLSIICKLDGTLPGKS
ncbi:MAG: acyl-CoA dehydrogenase family protein [Nannocystis sp.]|uniref:acyl-CoA dehydrogenase family protein n=1 Tax=Nannocystis sp. TaxID=1962667 RepID=UPI0024283F2F|nr:acyl-CoA dehydrogenase family protein [Nannocystis sp.]MBK9757967.1 acyl-CoA dehydrogenase family protein [Nannocystis sp.]